MMIITMFTGEQKECEKFRNCDKLKGQKCSCCINMTMPQR